MGDASLAGIQRRAERNRAHNRWVAQKLALFSLLMVVAPLGTFFGVRAWLGADTVHADSWSGFAAVLAVNVVVGLYVVSAWAEDDEDEVERVPPVGRFAKKEQ